MPIYRLTAGISNHMLASLSRQALACIQTVPETLPPAIRQEHHLAAAEFALRNIHFPENEETLKLARDRLSFEELFYLSVGLSFLKQRRSEAALACMIPTRPWEEFQALLPFTPTDAQRRVMDEAALDMASGRPMNRLVQGDVVLVRQQWQPMLPGWPLKQAIKQL